MGEPVYLFSFGTSVFIASLKHAQASKLGAMSKVKFWKIATQLERYWVRVLACAKLQRKRIDCTSVNLFLYGESCLKISTQTDSY